MIETAHIAVGYGLLALIASAALFGLAKQIHKHYHRHRERHFHFHFHHRQRLRPATNLRATFIHHTQGDTTWNDTD